MPDPIWGKKDINKYGKDLDGQRAFLASYGRSMPRFMFPEHHPDYLPPERATIKPAQHPEDKPFNYLKPAMGRLTISACTTRFKGHPRCATWKGEFPDAPPSGQDGKREQVWPTERGIFIWSPAQGQYAASTVEYPRHGFVPKRKRKAQRAKVAA